MGNAVIWIALGGCVLSCFFAATNIALKTFGRKRLAELFEAAGKGDRFACFIKRLPQYMLVTATLRTSMSLCVLLASLYAIESRLTDWHLRSRYLLAFLIAATLLSVFTVAIPASWARYHRERLLVLAMPVLDVTRGVLIWIVYGLSIFDPIVRRISGADLHRDDEEEHLTDELLSVVEEHQLQVEIREDQKEMLEAVVEFSNTTVGEVMTPRTDATGIEYQATLEQIKSTIFDEGHSRFPVYRESLDDIAGVLYAKDLLHFVGSDEPFEMRKVLREPMMVPETKLAREMLAEFKAKKVHLAIVLDEYGGTAGLVTIEDILEEIVGEIHDEYEPYEQEPAIHRVDESSAEVDARVYIDDLNDEMGLRLPEDQDYDTVGGFVFSRLGHIPGVGERFEYDNLSFTVTDAERTHVKRVRVELLPGLNGGKVKPNGR